MPIATTPASSEDILPFARSAPGLKRIAKSSTTRFIGATVGRRRLEKTLQKAGFVHVAHILLGKVAIAYFRS